MIEFSNNMHTIRIIIIIFIVIRYSACLCANSLVDKNTMLNSYNETIHWLECRIGEKYTLEGAHAAEALIALQHYGSIRRIYTEFERKMRDNTVDRIIIWRVLARLSSEEEKMLWIKNIFHIALSHDEMDAVHAIETLGKLGCIVPKAIRQNYKTIQISVDDGIAREMYIKWLHMLSGRQEGGSCIVDKLYATDENARLLAAYIIRKQKMFDHDTMQKLRKAMYAEHIHSPVYPYLLSAVILGEKYHDAEMQDAKLIKALLSDFREKLHAEISDVIADIGGEDELIILRERILQGVGDNINERYAYAIIIKRLYVGK